MDDTISRQAAINAPVRMVSEGIEWIPVYHVEQLPSAQPKSSESKRDLSDTISRQDAIMAVKMGALSAATLYGRTDEGSTALYETVRAIKAIPSVQPQRMKGKWIEQEDYNLDTYYDCSVCGESWCTIDGTPWDNGMNFCPNCGADMRGEQE